MPQYTGTTNISYRNPAKQTDPEFSEAPYQSFLKDCLIRKAHGHVITISGFGDCCPNNAYEPWSKLLKGGIYRGLYQGLL